MPPLIKQQLKDWKPDGKNIVFFTTGWKNYKHLRTDDGRKVWWDNVKPIICREHQQVDRVDLLVDVGQVNRTGWEKGHCGEHIDVKMFREETQRTLEVEQALPR